MPIPERLTRRLRERALPTVIVGLLLCVSVGAAISLLGSPPSTTELQPRPASPSSDIGIMYVHVVGAVNAPGIVTVRIGARVFDAIAAAGGCAPNADQNALNLAREVRSGEQIVVPAVGDAPVAAGAASANGASLINLNTADQAALESLPRVGPALAKRIIAFRTAHGGFQSVDELTNVTGIGRKMFDQIAPLVTV